MQRAPTWSPYSSQFVAFVNKAYVAATRLSDDYVIVVPDFDPDHALDDYLRRWEIETLFGCLKSRGFNLEDTHLTDPERIDKLLALVTLAFCWSYVTALAQQ